MADQEDVIADSSTAQIDLPTEGQADPAVTGVVPQIPDGRPVINLKAEMDRKFDQTHQTLNAIMETLQSLQRPAQQVQPEATYTDQQLQELAAAGSQQAQALYMSRIAQRETHQQFSAYQRQQTTQQQIGVLHANYPFRDSSHPLTQAAMQTKAALLRAGWANDGSTDLEAMKTAIADNPGIVHQIVSQRTPAPQAARQGAVAQQNAMGGGQTGQTPSRKPAQPGITKAELELAKRMGIKDPIKARERHEKRMAEGRSGVSPAIAIAIREQEGR